MPLFSVCRSAWDPSRLNRFSASAIPYCANSVSAGKKAYTRALAEAVVSRVFDFDRLVSLPDEAVRADMKRLKGIGDWTADIYLSECLLRPDILPKGDIAMQEAFRVLNHLPRRPLHEDFEAATRHWRPWRSAGTRMLWHFYLCERKRH